MSAKQGVFAVIASVAIQLTLGIIYIWSVFQTGIANAIFNGNNAHAAMVFSIVLALFGIGGLVAGKLTKKIGLRKVIFLGGLILGTGTMIASFVQPEFGWLLWLSYGLLGGLGMGFTYSTTIACAQKWYPHKKGMITGIIVAALGFGGVIFTPLIEWMIYIFGGVGTLYEVGGEMMTLRVLAIVFFVVCTVGSIFTIEPPEGHMADKVAANPKAAGTARNFTSKEMIKTPQFYLLAVAFIFSVIGGLMMIGFARPIAVAHGLYTTATIGVLAIALFNSIGRLFWGAVSDRLGRSTTMIILLIVSGGMSLLLTVASGYVIYVLFALIGFSFGGLLSNFPALTSDLFGSKFMAENYGFVLIGFGVGAIISSQVAGHFANVAYNPATSLTDVALMSPAFVTAAVFAGLAIGIMFILRVFSKKTS
ncbi:MAG: MFS transporter [Defluviitaleaceae bacterium]|nr:MFS transporter [Defluviitaleaceae bacterium]